MSKEILFTHFIPKPMIVTTLKIPVNMSLYASVPSWIREIPGHLKTQELCVEAVRMEPYS